MMVDLEVLLAIHSFVDAEIFLYCEVRIKRECFIAEWANIHLFILLDVFRALVRLDGAMVCTIEFGAVFAFNRQPVFLFACLV